MKAKWTILAVLALALGACTTGSYVSRSYTDDVYFNPADIPPPVAVEEVAKNAETAREKSANKMIISEIEQNDDGSKTMNNYVFNGSKRDADALHYDMDQMELQNSDTSVYYNDDEVKYVINNYYDADEMDYAYRIRRFHRPYFYDPFYWDSWSYYDPFYYSSWYYPSWSWGGSYGMYDPWYSWNWGYNWYSPYSSWGWGYPYSSYGWGYPYSYYGWSGGYNRYYNYSTINKWYSNPDNYQYGRNRASGTNVRYGDGRREVSSYSNGNMVRNKSGEIGNTDISGRRATSASGLRDGSERNGNVTRYSVSENEVSFDRRRNDSSSGSNLRDNTNTRPAQVYTRPGTTEQSNYNRSYSGSYTRPRISSEETKSGNVSSSPSTNYNNTYRSSSTYNRSSNSSVNSNSSRSYSSGSSGSSRSGSTYSDGNRNSGYSGSSNYSTGSSSRSYSGGSSGGFSGGSSSGGGYSGGSSSGGGGGERSGSSSSGRR